MRRSGGRDRVTTRIFVSVLVAVSTVSIGFSSPGAASAPTVQPSPTATPTPSPDPRDIKYVKVRDKEGADRPLDLRSGELGVGDGFFSMAVTVWDDFGKRELMVPEPEQGALFVYLDTAPDKGRRRAEVKVRVYYYKDKNRWESRVERVGKFKVLGFGTAGHPTARTVRFKVDADLIPVSQDTIFFYVASGWDTNKGRCKDICWDYAPDKGWGKYPLD
ncbi:MAG TPA: hypothetical protein VE174_05705 [Actinomycetota bacterium]|nr:hypothetical protein [Actinomycetota bacterium]